jgi:hypothetical protein
VEQEERRKVQLAAGKTSAMGGGQRCRETERGKQEEEDEDLFINLRKFKEFTVK